MNYVKNFNSPCKTFWYDIVCSANTWCFSKCSFQCPVGKWRKSSKGGQSMSIQNQGIQQLDLTLIGVVVYLIGCLSHLKSKNNHLMRWCTHTCTCYSYLPGRSQSHAWLHSEYLHCFYLSFYLIIPVIKMIPSYQYIITI